MITKEIAMNAKHSDTFYHKTVKNTDGSRLRARVNGKCATWKTRPDQYKLPMKHGLKHCFYISEWNAEEWLTSEEANANDKAEAAQKELALSNHGKLLQSAKNLGKIMFLTVGDKK